jgi:catechol 2,3-dioxygenase-like lactoylglutathione lyase family enzyme
LATSVESATASPIQFLLRDDSAATQRERQAVIEINGMAHVILTVSSFDAALGFYGRLMPFLGLKQVHQAENFAYWVGGRTAIGIQRCDEAYRGERFVQLRVGLHHLCFRARSREDIDKTAEFLREIGATIVRGPLNGDWAPGYYYVLAEDPDGIRVEINHVPGAGVLAAGVSFNPGPDYA